VKKVVIDGRRHVNKEGRAKEKSRWALPGIWRCWMSGIRNGILKERKLHENRKVKYGITFKAVTLAIET